MPDSYFEWGTAQPSKAPVLVHQLYGAMDAGEAGHLAMSQILSSLSAERVATFDTSRYVDYRSRRPIISVTNWCFSELVMPEIAIDLLTDYSGNKFLVLHGPEPDFHWDEFSQTVIDIAKRYEVESVIGLMGMPAGIPHTRSTFVHQTATDEFDVPQQPDMSSEIRITASMGMFVQHWAGQAGFHALGLVAGIPYYLADSQFPQGGAALIDYLAAMTTLQLPVGDLAAAANQMRNVIDKQISDSEEVMEIVHMIEQRYDSSMDNMDSSTPGFVATTVPEDIPSGDAIASKFQEFFHRTDSAHSLFPSDMEHLGTMSTSASSFPHKGEGEAADIHAPKNEDSTRAQKSPSAKKLDDTSPSTPSQEKAERKQFTSRKQRHAQRFIPRKQLRKEREAKKDDSTSHTDQG